MKWSLVAAMSLILAVSGSVQADITGNPEADGWDFKGNSLSNGVYVRGGENIGYDIYTTSFTVTDSSTFSLAGHDDAGYAAYYVDSDWTRANARTWQVGDTVIGIGGVFRSITAAEAGWDAFTGKTVNSTIDNENRFRLQAKIGSSAATWSPSTLAPTQTDGSGGTGDGGDGAFLMRTSGHHSSETWENFAGLMMGLQNEDHLGGYGAVDAARVIWTYDNETNRPASWQLLLNTSLLADDYAAAGFTGELPGAMAIASVQIENADYTDAVVSVPEPATMALLGLGTVALISRRRRNRRTA